MRILDTTVYEIAGKKGRLHCPLGRNRREWGPSFREYFLAAIEKQSPPTTKATGNTTAIAGQLKKASVIAASLTSPMPTPPRLNIAMTRKKAPAPPAASTDRITRPRGGPGSRWFKGRKTGGRQAKDGRMVQNTTAGHLPGRHLVNLLWRDGRRQDNQTIGQAGILIYAAHGDVHLREGQHHGWVGAQLCRPLQ